MRRRRAGVRPAGWVGLPPGHHVGDRQRHRLVAGDLDRLPVVGDLQRIALTQLIDGVLTIKLDLQAAAVEHDSEGEAVQAG
jgi:hypothetical protein